MDKPTFLCQEYELKNRSRSYYDQYWSKLQYYDLVPEYLIHENIMIRFQKLCKAEDDINFPSELYKMLNSYLEWLKLTSPNIYKQKIMPIIFEVSEWKIQKTNILQQNPLTPFLD